MASIRVGLTEDREAHVLMVLEEHRAAIRRADERREARMQPILKALGVPSNVPVKYDDGKMADGGVPALVYEAPDIVPAPPQPDAGSRSEKSTAPASAGD